MLLDTVYIYTDASFSKNHEIAFIGYAFFCTTQEHENISISEVKLYTFQIQEINNIRAEMKSAIKALESCPKSKQIILYSDCQTLSRLPLRREKLESTNFISQSKNRLLNNADLYQEFYSLYDLLKPEIHWVKGHTSSKTLSKIEKNFSYLDNTVRKNLRKAISSIIT